jgi:hypothetical protein
MDEDAVRKQAHEHGQAVAVRNLRQASGDVSAEAGSAARRVLEQLPDPTETAEVTEVRADGQEFVATIRYAGDGQETLVESRWQEREGRPIIVDLSVVGK